MMKTIAWTEADIETLRDAALEVRRQVLRMARRGGCFVGSAFSCADILVYLYTSFLRVYPNRPNDTNRDYFFLSKGHAVPALYATLGEAGFFEPVRLMNHLQIQDDVYWHPNRALPGVEFHAGSLGHLLSVGAGVAMDCKRTGQRNRVVVLSGDGELNEGSMWEAFLISAAYRLDNLIIIIDRNRFQANRGTEELIPLEPLAAKLKTFGLSVCTVDGHDFRAMAEAFTGFPAALGKPTVVLANTVRGKGLTSIEHRVDRWFCAIDDEELERLMRELDEQQEGANRADHDV